MSGCFLECSKQSEKLIACATKAVFPHTHQKPTYNVRCAGRVRLKGEPPPLKNLCRLNVSSFEFKLHCIFYGQTCNLN